MYLSPTDGGGSVSMLWYKKSKPLGKVKRRVQDLRTSCSSSNGHYVSDPRQDLSHNEAARLAMDSLLSRGLEGYNEVLNAEGEVDFLSEMEKTYILEHAKDSSTGADPEASDKESDADTKSTSHRPTLSSHSDLTVSGLDRSRQKGVTKNGPALGGFKIYFQCDHRACGMKDSVIELIRKAETVLAIVIDSFSDMELLFDLLEACKKRKVSVYLLLDHLNLDHFVSMWKNLKLDSKKFPTLSVRSVGGQTYCAKTGRKLTGQIAESFVIADWSEVLTGSFSFSWLSWHVYRSLVVLLRGSMAEGFQHEFYRLYSSSKPVPGFIDISLPCADPPDTTLESTQDKKSAVTESEEHQTKTMCLKDLVEDARDTEMKPKMPDLPESQSPELESSEGDTKPPQKTETATEVTEKPAEMKPKPLLQSAPVEKPKNTVGAICTPHDAQTKVEPLEKEDNKIQTQDANPQSPSESLTVIPEAESKVKVEESNPQQTADRQQTWYQPTLQRNRDGSQRRHWNCSLDFKPNNDFVPDLPSPLSPGASWRQQVSPTARPNWMPQSRQNSYDSNYRTGLNTSAQAGWRPFQSSVYTGLQRSKSMNDRHSAGFSRAGRHLSMS
ncbi:protein FAM83A-like [Notolabrus celidotus]|uniref:protein FAM83A-like n=1 Tax=Notolabrus celidotus TaxID=1203425 RepID=UPI0014908A5E|nr:protein FAM83A-like [Notolabrus celidotus]